MRQGFIGASTLASALFILVGCASTKTSSADDEMGGILSFMVQASCGVLNEDTDYSFALERTDGSRFETRRTFPAGTTVRSVAVELARTFRDAGFAVVQVPELGVVRVGFVPGLKASEAAGGPGFVVSHGAGRRGAFDS